MTHSVFSWLDLALSALGVLALFLIALSIFTLVMIRKKESLKEDKIVVKKLNEIFLEQKNKILGRVLENKEFKKIQKDEKKQKIKSEKSDIKKRIFVLDFSGDMAASAVENLRDQVSALLLVVTDQDEIVVRLESPGGLVHSYGLGASQLARIRERGIPLTICVDKIAASGGYLMACLGNKILAAPFAIIGSIGVVANIPNFNRLLHKNDVDYLELTAGEYKRTLSVFGPISEKGQSKFQEQLEETHALFKEHVARFRPSLDLNTVATGEYWLGTKALELHLVDALKTSDDYLWEAAQTLPVYHIFAQKKKGFKERLMESTFAGLKEQSHKIAKESLYPLI